MERTNFRQIKKEKSILLDVFIHTFFRKMIDLMSILPFILYKTINGTNFSYRKMILCENSKYTCVIIQPPFRKGVWEDRH